MRFLVVTISSRNSITGSLDVACLFIYETDGFKLRFRHVPSYGNGVIRRFTNNTSEMKKLAARDFEDILQDRLVIYSADVCR
jgi:hypothetical protein